MGATKEFFIPATGGNLVGYTIGWVVVRCDAANENAYMDFKVPHDFTSISNAEIILISRATQAAANWDIYAVYAAVGGPYDQHTASDTASTYNITNLELFAIDISGLLTALAADDYVGIRFCQGTAGHNADILGVRFKYT